ncbi:UNVERIFIED_CONTAM: hypothetical protein Sradi_5530000 [Sesamum radiatum]|uniref:Uncharacterized protein n=1 Tax=Sesamum radiatum TaxID=300843 RepID=A0AAW2LC58_SESRA
MEHLMSKELGNSYWSPTGRSYTHQATSEEWFLGTPQELSLSAKKNGSIPPRDKEGSPTLGYPPKS